MSNGLVIERNTDGTATINFPGGGIQTVSPTGGVDPVQALQQAYGSRISGVVSSNKTAGEQSQIAAGVRKAIDDATIRATVNETPVIKSDEAANTGYSTADIQAYLNSNANLAGGDGTKYVNGQLVPLSVDEYVQKLEDRGKTVLSQYLPAEEIANMSTKQLLAAEELWGQGGGAKEMNSLSVEDIDWIRNKANSFGGAVTSPNQQAISLGAGTQIVKPALSTRTPDQARQTDAASVFRPETIQPTQPAAPATPVTPAPQPVATQPVAPPTFPTFPTTTATPYGLPPTYTGSGYMPMFTGVMQPAGQVPQMPYSQTMYGTLPFTYTPTTPYTVGAGGTAAPATITAPQQMEVRIYRNNSGLTTSITFVDGKPTTPIPSGFFPADQAPPVPTAPSVPSVPAPPAAPQPPTVAPPQMAMGGLMPSTKNIVSGFKPNAMQRIASSLGYTGDIANFNNFLAENPAANQKYNSYMQAAQQMANGGYVRKYQEGGDVQQDPRVLSQQYIPQQNFPAGATLPQVQATIAKTPGLPTGATVVPTGTAVELGQLVAPTSGQVSGQVALPTAQASTTAAAMPQVTPAAKVSTIESTQAVSATVDALQAAQGTLDPRAEVLAAQQTASSVGNVQAAQGNAILMTNPVQRQIQDGELIAPAANAETAAKFTEQIEAAEATPSKQATVQGQLEQLMTQFEGGKTPAWAAASMRNAMATLSARGLGASSLAGQAVIQAAMEAALPIAQLDAQTQASFEAQNLSNRQQRAMLAAQQRAAFLGQEFDQAFQSRVANAAKISDVANMNFTAEQQVALENSRIANTMQLQNLSNRQAVVLAEAAALANMDMANLNNRQQAAVMNAQNFLAVDMQNLSNQQQTDLFKAQSRIQALFTDQAAQNASQQFNASSENQVNQFFSSLAAQVGQFNATQANAQAQFNAGQINTIERFNAEINNQRDQFNAQNRLIIDQSNAQWRREISTAATAAVNRANEINAAALVGLSQSAYNNLWQYYRDNMEWAWTSAENERQRVVNLAITQMQADASKDIQSMKQDYESSAAFGGLIGKMLTSDLTGSILGGIFG